MKRIVLAAMLVAAATATRAADVGVSISIAQPGMYGRIDLGSFPRPALVYAEPMIIHRGPARLPPPVYMHVPPGHAKDWRKHCAKYDACGYPVYFVQDRWYDDVYMARHRGDRGDRGHRDDRRDRGDHGRGDGRGRDWDHDGDRGRGNDGPGRGRGRGHD